MKIVVKGMRNTTHSVALVNQFNLIALGKKSTIDLYHHDFQHEYKIIEPGFKISDVNFIKNIKSAHSLIDYDIELNMEPLCKDKFNSSSKFNFFVTEFGTLNNDSITYLKDSFSNNTDLIVPSKWVKNIVERNLNRTGIIHIIPHGVDDSYFYENDIKTKSHLRTALNFSEDDYIFLNLGAMTWNKGIDKLLIAFNVINKKYKNAKLILKDSANLYGIRASDVIMDLINKKIIDDTIVNSITIISQNLNFEQLNSLHNISNCYLAPYRAEGFNIPVLESMFCNSSVIVSNGGSTDDFANTDRCSKVETDFIESEIGYYLEPNLDALISLMESNIRSNSLKLSPDGSMHQIYKENFTTEKIADLYLKTFIEKINRK